MNDQPSTAQFSPAVRPGSPELKRLIAAVGEGAARRDLERLHPHDIVALVREARLGALRLPLSEGGGGASLHELIATVVALGGADPNVAHILRNHFTFVERYVGPNAGGAYPWLRDAVAAGAIFGLASGELGTTAVGSRALETSLTRDGDGYRLNGKKFYSTGSLYSDYILVRALDPAGVTASVIIPAARAGVTLVDDWDGVGQRLTGTGTTILTDVQVAPGEVIADTDGANYRLPYQGVLPQLYLTAVIAGILRNVVADGAALVRRRGRTYVHAPAEKAVDDPILQQILGQISSSAFAAEATVLAAADALDRSAVNSADPDLAHAASLAASKAKVVIDEMAVRAGSLLFDVGGASATQRNQSLDRHWRNARTLASHNPAAYKALAIGNLEVNGRLLPDTGFF